MNFTDQAKALLKHLEGCRLRSYQDEAGVWTIGYGHTGRDVGPGLVWTQAQADQALDHDLERFIAAVQCCTAKAPAQLTDSQFSALVIFAFNIGVTGFIGSTALRDVQTGRLSCVPAAVSLWNKRKDASGVHVVSPILVSRREAECNLWRSA